MHRVHTNDLLPGMEIGRTIFDANNHVLLAAGVVLSEKLIARINVMGIGSVYIQDEASDVPIPDVILDETRQVTIQTLNYNYTRLKNGYRLEIGSIADKVKDIISQCLKNRGVLVNLTDIRSYDEHTFSHSTNVCVLAILAGISMGLANDDLLYLGIGALLHDIGKISIESELLNKPARLTEDEFRIIQEHSMTGFTILNQYDEVPSTAACIAYQHHERWNGSGYPRGLVGSDINPLARIVAVADIYEALLGDRPYRPSYTVQQAIKTLNRLSGVHLDNKSVSSLLSNIAVYPVGTVVILNTGARGVVIGITAGCPTRPVVRVIFDARGQRLGTPYAIDLCTVKDIFILKTVYD